VATTGELETFFHPGKQTLYLRPQGMNQFETVAELWVAPINLGEHVPFRTVYPANLRIRTALRFLLAFVLLWHFHTPAMPKPLLLYEHLFAVEILIKSSSDRYCLNIYPYICGLDDLF